MYARALVLIVSVTSVLLLATVCYAQPSPTPTPSPAPVQVIYTGRLLGYFRSPADQSGLSRFDQSGSYRPGCLADSADSLAAAEFINQRKKNPDAILVGAGDNFSPRLESRILNPTPDRTISGVEGGTYVPGNKELYYWYHSTDPKMTDPKRNDHWIFYDQIGKVQELRELRYQLQEGVATIPTDSVGCFLGKARFAAVVPGKHDFYFGAERLRQLARFMASLSRDIFPKDSDLPRDYRPPQMLAANLVIETTTDAPSANEPKPKEIADWKWPEGVSISNFKDKKRVYPWFSTIRVTIELKNDKAITAMAQWYTQHEHVELPKRVEDLKLFLNNQLSTIQEEAEKAEYQKLQDAVSRVSLCPSIDPNKPLGKSNDKSNDVMGTPNQVVLPPDSRCRQADFRELKFTDKSLLYDASFGAIPDLPKGKNGHYSTVEPGKNYGLCLVRNEMDKDKKKYAVHNYCLRFSVYTPFFSAPRPVPLTGSNYTDPDPFVFLPNADKANEVVIFGVVETALRSQIGVLNFSWLNQQDSKMKTVASIEEPDEALRQQLDYFEEKYLREHDFKQKFLGLKILLAQMSPQQARILATHFPEFQIVVTGAADEQATPNITMRSTWTEKSRGTFFATPFSSFDVKAKKARVSLGHIDACQSNPSQNRICADTSAITDGTWDLSAKARPPDPVDDPAPAKTARARTSNTQTTASPDSLQGHINAALTKDCMSGKSTSNAADDEIKWLTLCEIRKRTGADVALLQERDFFSEWPDASKPEEHFQQDVDRLIWKGDLLILLYVPGSALKKALGLSDKFEAADNDPLSQGSGRRQLQYVGITRVGDDYVINETPIDDNKIYSVATSDFIGAGDTGYPDFRAAALDPKTQPTEFPARLDPISAIVCASLFSDRTKAAENCLPALTRDEYLDETIAQAVPIPNPPGLSHRFWKIFPFKLPPAEPELTDPGDIFQREVQRRSIWMLSLKNFSLGLDSLSNNKTDDELSEKFGGNPTAGVTTKKKENITMGLDLRLSNSSHRGERFVETTMEYARDTVGDAKPQVSRSRNKATLEAGYLWNLRGGRSPKRLGINLSGYGETQLRRPFTNFDLGTGDTLKISQDRSFPIVGRAGFRWQNGPNSFEVGVQGGRELHSVVGYRFPGTTVECRPDPKTSFAACIKNASTPPGNIITKDSVGEAILATRPRVGFYWKTTLSVPINERIKYDFTQTGDFYFTLSGDNATNTRYRDESKHSLKFEIWPSLSIGPSFRLFVYENKVGKTRLFQKEFGLETTFSFDLFNRREKLVQIEHKP